MKIRKADLKDLNIITDMFVNAINLLNTNNINQWDELYPTYKILKEDILKNEMYVGVKNNVIVSAVVVNKEFDEQYKNGDWKYSNKHFVVIHRLCVNPTYQNRGIGKTTMTILEDLLKKDGVTSIRLDSFSLNPSALKMYEKLGYKKVGETNWRKGLFYLMEKKL